MESTFENELNNKGRLIYTNKGTSMMPLLRQHHDLIIIEKPEGRLKKYDVPLYKREGGKYILHRILKVRDHDYVICGDNLTVLEYGITDDDIIGVMTGFVRDGKTHYVNEPGYLFYVHLWCDFLPVRFFLLKVRNRLRRYGGAVLRRLRRNRSTNYRK
ncbi:MAG: S24/S26 family peptidase [Bilifractor sp.]|jgi:signal peptidase I